MTDDASAEQPTPADESLSSESSTPNNIYLVSYPKIIYLYPTFFAAIFAGIYMTVVGNASGEERHSTEIAAMIFLGLSTINLVVLAFDFPRTTSLTLFFFFAAVLMGSVLLFRFNPDLLPFVHKALKLLRPWANSQFYFIFAGVLFVIYCIVGINVQFDYWEVRPNELLHHHGILSDLERFSAPNLRIDKEINDVFEYLLLRSGRLILHPSNERRAIVLENVFFINRKEQQITRMLGAVQVQVRTD